MDGRTPNKHLVAGAVVLGLLWTIFSESILRGTLSGFDSPYPAILLLKLTDVAVMAGLIMLATRKGPAAIWKMSGLGASPAKPLLMVAAILAPAAVIAAFIAPVASDLEVDLLIVKGGIFPLFEEVIYRGLVVGALVAAARWRVWEASLVPAVVVGIMLLVQGQGLAATIDTVLIMSLTGLFFGWMFVEWRFNLWPALLLHIGLSSLWVIFAMSESKADGFMGDALRVAILIAAFAMTDKMTTKRRIAYA